MGAQDYGVFSCQVFNQLPDFDYLFGIQSNGWLIKNQYLWLVDYCLGNSQSLFIAFRNDQNLT